VATAGDGPKAKKNVKHRPKLDSLKIGGLHNLLILSVSKDPVISLVQYRSNFLETDMHVLHDHIQIIFQSSPCNFGLSQNATRSAAAAFLRIDDWVKP
jgi:hypothetical protein